MAGVFQVSDNDQSVQRECPHRGQGKAVPGKNRRTDIHFECTDTDTQNKQKKKNQTPPRQVPVKHDHMSPGEQGHTAQPSSGWQRDVIVEGGIGVLWWS